MELERIESYFAQIMEKLNHIYTKEQVLEKIQEHVTDCPAQKKQRILNLIGAMIAGASFIGGVVVVRLLTQ